MKTLFSYCMLSLIQEKRVRTGSLTDVFVEFTEAILSIESWQGYYVIKDLRDLYSKYGLNVPYSIIQTILIDLRRIYPDYVTLNKDFSFEIVEGALKYLQVDHAEVNTQVSELEEIYRVLCKKSGIEANESLSYFIDMNKTEIVSFVTRGVIRDVENREQFKVFQLLCLNDRHRQTIERMLSGSTISTYLELDLVSGFDKKKILLDTNFLVSFSNLHSEESYQNSIDLVQFGKKLGYEFYVLPETLKEYKNLLKRIADSNRGVSIFTALDRNSIEYGCQRRKLTWQSLLTHVSQIDVLIRKFGIFVVDQATNTKLYRESFGSPFREMMKDRPFNPDGITHDVMALMFVKSFWTETETKFSEIPAFFVTDTHGYLENKVNQDSKVPYVIRTNELLNVIWLTHPHGDRPMAKLQLQRLSTVFFEKTLPKKEDLRKLDARLNIAKDLIATPQDCVDITSNLALLDADRLKPLFDAETADIVAARVSELAEDARRLRAESDERKTEAVSTMVREIEARSDKMVAFVRAEAEQSVQVAAISTLRARKKHLEELLERDGELLLEKRVRLDTIYSGGVLVFRVLSGALFTILVGIMVPIYFYLVVPNWQNLDPLFGLAGLVSPIAVTLIGVLTKKANPLEWFSSLADSFFQRNKKAAALRDQIAVVEARMSANERELNSLVV